jgi:hypothetical protein
MEDTDFEVLFWCHGLLMVVAMRIVPIYFFKLLIPKLVVDIISSFDVSLIIEPLRLDWFSLSQEGLLPVEFVIVHIFLW